MNPDELNKAYWSTVAPEKILAGHYLPGDELLTLLAPHSRILDIGCGTGKLTEYLHQAGHDMTGIDINPEALAESAKRNPEISYLEADITTTLPFANASFDGVTMAYVLVSMIDTATAHQVAQELRRVLKPGGLLWVAEATRSPDYQERYRTGKALTGIDSTAVSFSKDPEKPEVVERVIRHYAPEEITALFAPLQKISSERIAVRSSSSGMVVETLVSVFQKPDR